jgi:hypothetical protein
MPATYRCAARVLCFVAPSLAACASSTPTTPGAPEVSPIDSTVNAAYHANRRVGPDTPLTDRQLEYLKHDATEWARGSVDATRAGKLVDCKKDLPHASEEYCERILQVDGRTGVKFIALQQRFFTGYLGQADYQAEFHRIFLEHDIALEQFMPTEDFVAHEHHQPGDDSFLDLTNWWQDNPDFLMGDEVFEDSASPPATARRAKTTARRMTITQANLATIHDGVDIGLNGQLQALRISDAAATRAEPQVMRDYRHGWKAKFIASRAPGLPGELARLVVTAEDRWIDETRAARFAFVVSEMNEKDYVDALKSSRRVLLRAVQETLTPAQYEGLYHWRAGVDPFDPSGSLPDEGSSARVPPPALSIADKRLQGINGPASAQRP